MPRRPTRSQPPGRPAGRRATNLSLDPAAVARGERYGARTGRRLSQLVNDFLAALPADEDPAELDAVSPTVRRLHGAAGRADAEAAAAGDARAAYRDHLATKYGLDPA